MKRSSIPTASSPRSRCSYFLAKADQLMGENDAKELVSMARGCDIPIYEHCYLAGLVDGMHLKETLEQMKMP